MNRALRRLTSAVARQTRDEWQPFERKLGAAECYALGGFPGRLSEAWTNNRYAVLVYLRAMPDGSDTMHLAIRRADNGIHFPWADLQRIKNEIVGADSIAIEVFPKQIELVDRANMRHLFVWPEGAAFPFTIRGEWR